jgi:thymidylate kinase|tara:strand:- start:15669 stop:16139 length:471 start_codon:yes stop_codon:yes gene_type:complete
MKIILEGPDCAGKTTLANLLKQKLTDYLYIHNGIYSKAYKPHVDCLKLDNVIIDRHWPSELVYGTIFRAGPSYNIYQMEQHCKNNATNKYILCLPPKDLVLKRFLERKEHEDFEDVSKVYDAYHLFKNMYPYWTLYNYAEHNTEEFVKREIYGQRD